MKRIVILLFAGVFLVQAGAATGEQKVIVLDDCKYASAEAAGAQWKPVEKDFPTIGAAAVGGKPALKLPCKFSGNGHWNIAWQREGKWDLSGCRKITMDVSAGDRPAVMLMWLRSGDGWYWYSWLHVPNGTNTVTLPRNGFAVDEGRPGDWSRISAIRLAVAREDGTDRAILVSNIRAHVDKGLVAVYRNDAAGKSRGSIRRVVSYTTDSLDSLGIAWELLDDKAVASGRLAGKKVAILPYNPVLPKDAAAAIKKFVAGGGKLIVCYHLPKPLGELLGVRIDGKLDGKADRLDAIWFKPTHERNTFNAKQPVGSARKIIPTKDTNIYGYWYDKDVEVVNDTPAVITLNRNGCFVGHVPTRHYVTGRDFLFLETLGPLWPGMEKIVYDHRMRQLGKVAGFGGVKELTAAVKANCPKDNSGLGAHWHLSGARDCHRFAEKYLKEGKLISAAQELNDAQNLYLRAYAASVPSQKGEFRAVWCHSPHGVRGMNWDKAMKTLADAGFNAIIVNMSWGGTAAYKSKLLPIAKQAGGRDLLAECVAAGKKHGIAVHAWKCNMRCKSDQSGKFYKDLLAAGRFQTDFEGKPLNNALCPSDPANLKLEVDSMVEMARDYDVAGIHFDYIRYPGIDVCYCDRCRKRFEAEYKVKVKNWPGDVRTGPLQLAYQQFRRDRMTAIVAGVSRDARKAKPDILISAAVYWHCPSARIRVGQDWKLWVEKGYLDFVCPMQYTSYAADFDGWTQFTSKWVGGRIPLMPGIGATLGMTPEQTLHHILITRKHKTAGFVLFNYYPVLAENYLPLLRAGATAEKTKWTPPKRKADK